MTRYTFAQLGQWTRKAQNRIDFTLAYAVEKLMEAAQLTKAKGGRMPVDTGALRASLLSELNGSPAGISANSYAFVVGSIKGGDYATFWWTMEYAAAVNNGNRGRPGANFVEWAADQWQSFVREGERMAKVRYP